MTVKRYRVTLTVEERDELARMLSRGKAAARELAHARVLLQADTSEAGLGWTRRLLAEQRVALEIVPGLSHETVRLLSASLTSRRGIEDDGARCLEPQGRGLR